MTTNSKEHKGCGDLKKKTIVELKELLERQQKILQNRSFILKLPDKGSRIILLKSQLEDELKRRDHVDVAEQLLSKLNLNGVPEQIEWAGNSKPSTSTAKTTLDSDDDSDVEVDPLKLIATHSGTQTGRTTKKQSVKSLVTAADVEQVKTFKYADDMCKKYDTVMGAERFKPNEPKSKEEVKTGFRSSSENVRSKLGRHWEVTAATPPVPLHGDTKLISLADSLIIQQQQAQRIKEIEIHEAMSRLRQPPGVKMSSQLPTSNLMKYRNPPDPARLFEGTPHRERPDDGCLEGDEEEKGGAVFYNLIDEVPDN